MTPVAVVMTATTGSTASSSSSSGGGGSSGSGGGNSNSGGGNGKQGNKESPTPTSSIASTSSSLQPNTNASKEEKDKLQVDSSDSKQTIFKRKSLKRDAVDLEEGDEVNKNCIPTSASSIASILGKSVKRFKIYNQDNVPVVYCEISVDDGNDKDNGDDKEGERLEDVSKIQYTIRPFTGEPFVVSVREHGCLFDLYDSIYTHTSILWDQQVISVNGQVLASDEGSLLNTPLPECRELDLNVKMSSGMDSAPLNPDLDLSDPLSYEEEEAEEEEKEEGEEEAEEEAGIFEKSNNQQHFTVNLDEANLVQLSLLKITPATSEEPSSAVLPRVEKTLDVRLTGSAACHFCHVKCRPALQFTCKCGHVFCHLHRYHDQHKCPIDIVALDRQNLSRANPRVVKDRL